MNLLEETIIKLLENGKTPDDVIWVNVGPQGRGYITWENFREMADWEYDEQGGGVIVNVWLQVVGVDWWLERAEYDGEEWWEYKTLPGKPSKKGYMPKDLLFKKKDNYKSEDY